MPKTPLALLIAAALLSTFPVIAAEPAADVAAQLASRLRGPEREIALAVLARNPDLARLAARVAAAEARASQAAALPDPTASLTAFLAPPETRVGPQVASVAVSQRFPGWGKLALREEEALYQTAAARATLAARRLELVTETRRLHHELAFLAAREAALRADRATLDHYEELARARYASGVGLERSAIQLQAEITRVDRFLLELGERRVTLTVSLAALADEPYRPPAADLEAAVIPALPEMDPDLDAPLDMEALVAEALRRRPEIVRARAHLAAAETAIALTEKARRPDLTAGLAYTVVGARDDAAGRANPPEDDGDDIVGISLGVGLPVWRRRIEAAVREATALHTAAEDELRAVAREIESEVQELAARLPLTLAQLDLLGGLLTVQAEEALRSTEVAYAAGSIDALDLLDAERLLFEVRVAAARTRADAAIVVARLEGAVAAPLATLLDLSSTEDSDE